MGVGKLPTVLRIHTFGFVGIRMLPTVLRIHTFGSIGKLPTAAIIGEVHVRDLTVHPGSGVQHKGKYLGVAEGGTRGPQGVRTGFDHLQDLGLTHVHLLPTNDEDLAWIAASMGLVCKGQESCALLDRLLEVRELVAAEFDALLTRACARVVAVWRSSPSSICSPTRRMGFSAVRGFWKIIAISRPRSCARLPPRSVRCCRCCATRSTCSAHVNSHTKAGIIWKQSSPDWA
jgi:hypothetical protein